MKRLVSNIFRDIKLIFYLLYRKIKKAKKGARYALALLSIALLLCLFLLAAAYLKNIVLPEAIRNVVLNDISKEIGKTITVEDVFFAPFKGIVIKNLKIYDSPDLEGQLLEIGEINFNCLTWPFFKKKIIIPTLYINRLKAEFRDDPDDKAWALSRLKKAELDKLKKRHSVYIYNAVLANGSVRLIDSASSPQLLGEIENLHADISLSIPQIKFSAKGTVSQPEKDLLVSVKGAYDYDKEKLAFRLRANNFLLDQPGFPYENMPPVEIQRTFADIGVDVALDRKELSVNGGYVIPEIRFAHKTLEAAGGISGDIHIETKEPFLEDINYTIKLRSKDFTVTNLPYINTITDLNGDIIFTPSKISTDNLKGRLGGDPLYINANIANFKAPLLSMQILSDLELKNIEPILKERLPEALQKSLVLNGKAGVILNYTDTLITGSKPKFSSSIMFQGASLKTHFLPEEIRDITGRLEIEDDIVTAKNIRFDFGGKEYRAEGSAKDIDAPKVSLNLESDEFSLKGRFIVDGDDAHIVSADIGYKKIEAAFVGDVYQIQNPHLNIRGNANFSLEDLAPFIPEKYAFLKNAGMRGSCRSDIAINGALARPKLLKIGLDLESDLVKIENLYFRNLALKMASKDGRLHIRNLNAEPYGGALNITAWLDLEPEAMPYEVKGHLRGAKLERLIEEGDLRNSGIYGNLNGSVTLTGKGDDLRSLNGEGWIHVKEAHLGPLPIFIPIVSTLVDFFRANVAGYEKIMLKEATGTFVVAKERLITRDLILWGDEASVLYDGTIDFKGNLDFTVENNFAEGLIDNKTGFGKALSRFITGVGLFIGRARLGGTLKQPKYEIVPFGVFKKRTNGPSSSPDKRQ